MVTSGYGPHTAWHDCTLMVWSNNSQDSAWIPCDAREGVARAYGTHTGPVWDPQGYCTAPLWTRNRIDTTRIWKNPVRSSYVAVPSQYGPVRSLYGLFTRSLRSLDPYGVHKHITHALKLYGPRTARQNWHGTARGLYGPREWTYDFCSQQPMKSPGITRTGPGSVMWWLGH